jgi:hypothetical protein
MSIDEKIACGINAAFGAAVGFAIYFLPLSGWRFLFTKRGGEWWNGWLAFLVCVGGGALIGILSYTRRHDAAVGLANEGIYEGEGGQWLLVKRLGVIVGAIIAFYYIWQLAKSV